MRFPEARKCGPQGPAYEGGPHPRPLHQQTAQSGLLALQLGGSAS